MDVHLPSRTRPGSRGLHPRLIAPFNPPFGLLRSDGSGGPDHTKSASSSVRFRAFVRVVIRRAPKARNENTFTTPVIRNFCALCVWLVVVVGARSGKFRLFFAVCVFRSLPGGGWCVRVRQVPFENDEDIKAP